MPNQPSASPDSLSKQAPILLGMDIGGTKTGLILGTLAGEILSRVEIPTPSSQPYPLALQNILAAADALLNSAEKPVAIRPEAISVSIGGPLDIQAGVIYSPPHLPKWVDAPLKADLQAHFRLPVYIEHDGNAGALAEFYFGAGRGVKNLVFLTMGTGIGAGIILDGKIYRGATDMAGEVGHIRISECGPVEYGKAGAWEGYCSGAGMVKLAHLYQPGLWPERVSTQQIVEAALTGENRACSLVRYVGEWLGKGIAILVDILNPELVIVGTLGVVLGDLLLEPARQAMKSEALSISARACRIEPAQLGNSLGNVSALIAAINAYYSHEWPISPNRAEGASPGDTVIASLKESLEVRNRTIQDMAGAIAKTAEKIVDCFQRGGKVLTFGNGGSAAAAQHLVGELIGRFKAERRPLPAIALTADSSVVTCIGNDYAFDDIFARQVCALAQPGDLVIGFTTSGRSPNVIKGLKKAEELGAQVIALTGEEGLQGQTTGVILAIPSRSTARIQEEHEAIIHAWCAWIDRVFSN